jgi:transposase-like protein
MKCPNCKTGNLEKATGTEPFNQDHLQCDNCDSTFNIEEIKDSEKKR